MYMKIFPHGQGDGSGPTHYLVRPDYPGRDELPPEVLRGDVETTSALIDSLDTKWKFTAGVLSWHPDDTVTPATEAAILSGITDMETNITSRCRSLGKMFDRKYLASILLSAVILLLTTLACWGLMTLYQYRITDLRQEIAAFQNRKETLESNNAKIRAIFKGLTPYQVEDKDYLLTPQGWTIIHAGTVGKQDAWSIVRK